MKTDSPAASRARGPARWPTELRLAVQLAGAGLAGGQPPAFAPGEAFDAKAFLRLVARHRLAPAIQPFVRAAGLGEELAKAVDDAFQRNRLLGLRRMREMAEVHGALERAGVESIALKGVLAGMEIHGDLSRRHAGDLDILVRPESFRQADAVLTGLGFAARTLDFPIGDSLLPWALRQACDKEYENKETGTAAELHWRLVRNAGLLPLPVEELFRRAKTVPVAGQPVRALDQDSQLLFLVVHGAKHGWFRLFWLLDVAKLLPVWQPTAVRDLFRRNGLERVLNQSVLLVKELFGPVLPEELVAPAEKDAAAAWLAEQALEQIVAPPWDPKRAGFGERWARHRYALTLRPGFAYVWAHFCQSSLSEHDWQETPLPRGWEWLYYPLRPVFWLRRRFRQKSP